MSKKNIIQFPRSRASAAKNPGAKRDGPAVVILLPVIRIECAPRSATHRASRTWDRPDVFVDPRTFNG